MKDYGAWMSADVSEGEELVFDMCEKTNIKINSSSSDYQCILNDANEWQLNVDKLVLIKKSVHDVSVGDYITAEGNVYIVAFEAEDRDFFKSAKARKCVSSLKWLNSKGIAKEAYFTPRNDNLSNYGLQQGQIIDLGNERRQIIIQSNADTKQINKTKRFIFDERSWSVTSVDRLRNGLISLALEEGEIDPAKDNVELRIADYYGNAANYSVTIIDGDTINVNSGTTVQLTVEVKNNDVVVTENVLYSSTNESIATVDSTGLISAIADGNATIAVKLELDNTIQDSISVSVATVVQDNFTLSVAETPSVIKANSKVFNAVVKNNGTVVTGRQIQWSLFADDETSSTTLAAITSYNDTQCTLRGDNLGYVKLKMVLVDPDPRNNVPTFIRIQVKSLI